MRSDLSIRLATSADVEELARLNAMVQDLHLSAEPGIFLDADLGSVMDHLRSLLERPSIRIWVAEADRRVIGYLVLVQHERPATPFRVALRYLEIDQIGVVETGRRRGVGTALMQTVERYARERSITRLELTSWSFNADAHRFFHELGYEPVVIRFARDLPPGSAPG